MTAPDTVVLIHGLWVTALSWEHWVERYEARGLTVIARELARHGRATSRTLRRDPSALADIGAADVIDHYAAIIEALAQPPIIMGHSFGGAFTQVLLDRGLGAAGVAIDASAVKGITKLPLSTLRSAWSGLQQPGQPAPADRDDRRRVPLRLHQHARRRRRARPPTSATRRPARAACCSTARWRTSCRAPPPPSTSATTTARRCC